MDSPISHGRTCPRDELVQEGDHRSPWFRMRPRDHCLRSDSAARAQQRRPHTTAHAHRPVPNRGERLVNATVKASVRARRNDQERAQVQLLLRPRHLSGHHGTVTQRHRHPAPNRADLTPTMVAPRLLHQPRQHRHGVRRPGQERAVPRRAR